MIKFIAILMLIFAFSCSTNNVNVAQEIPIIETILNEWHHAAAVADEDKFFSTFTKDGIYIGTDPTEHWQANELKEWSKKYFERESAWSFEPYDRNIYFSEDGKTVWFDELLKTWMGTCRGSGVMKIENGTWKIAHYHLAIAVPNDKIDGYLELINPQN